VPLGPLDSLTGYHLRYAYARFGADFARIFADSEMRQVLFGVLSVIFANPGINQGKVGKALGVQRTNMVALINQLVELGLVRRSLDREDRRAFSLDLTEHGRETVNATLERIRAHEERMLSALTSGERQTLLALLKKINARSG
jgi:DNA-binding MarR family transcriptional regulator